NGRLDVALLVDADLHLPASAPLAAEVRPLLPAGKLLSTSVHSEAEARAAAGADLALVGPVTPPRSQPGATRAPPGRPGFEAVRAALPCPAFAIGGVTADSLPWFEGAAGAAVIGAVMHAGDPAGEVAALLAALCSAPG